MLDPELVDILACPACRAEVRDDGDFVVCTSCGLRYPVRDGIPILLVDEAVPVGAPAHADAARPTASSDGRS